MPIVGETLQIRSRLDGRWRPYIVDRVNAYDTVLVSETSHASIVSTHYIVGALMTGENVKRVH